MSSIRVVDVSRVRDGAGSRLAATLLDAGQRHELTLAAPEHLLSDAADPFVPPALLRAMRTGGELVLDVPVSARLLAALPTIQDIFCSFEPLLRRVTVVAPQPVARAAATGTRTAAFFSAGVDSFYTMLKHRSRLDALLFVHGFDIPLAQRELRERVVGSVRGAAERVGLPLVELQINLRPFLEDRTLPGRTATWGMTQGAALAAVSLALAGTFDRVLIPSGAAYGDLYPWGTHPLLDPLWSTEALAVEHDGCEARRLQKVGVVAGDAVAMETLRVCFKNAAGAYNCGVCDKCVRTMAELRVHGALTRCRTFSRPLDLRMLDGPPPQLNERLYLEDMRRLLQETGRDPELLAAIERRLRQRHLVRRARALVVAKLRGALARVGGGRAPQVGVAG